MIKRLFNFMKKIIVSALKVVSDFIKSLFQNFAGVLILVGATIGFTSLVSQLPFYISLPLWIEVPLAAPFISMLAIITLVQIMKFQLGAERCQ